MSIPELNLHDYKWLEYADVMRLAQLGLLQYAQRDSHVFYVNANTSIGRDGQHSGGRFRSPLNTIAAALAKVESGRGDFVLIQNSPGTNITEYDVSIAKADLVIAGLAPARDAQVIIKPTTDPTAGIFSMTAAADRVVLKNLYFDGRGDGDLDLVCIKAIGGADNVHISDCHFQNGGYAVSTTNVAVCSLWLIENCNVYDMSAGGFSGYFGKGIIRKNVLLNTDNTAWSAGGIIALDNTTTANSDGVQIIDNVIMAGTTAVMASGIYIAANVIGAGVFNNLLGGLATKPIEVPSGVDLTNGVSIVHNFAHDLGADASTGEYADVEDKLIGEI